MGALENAKLSNQIYPDWICRFYIDKGLFGSVGQELKSFGCEVVSCEIQPDQNPMLWRLLVFNDNSSDIWISRDCDSRLNDREKKAVDEWLDSDKTLHVMRDSHNHNYEIMGGMFGLKSSQFKKKYGEHSFIVDLSWKEADDQEFLKRKLAPVVNNDVFSHDHWLFNKPMEPSNKIKDPLRWQEAYGVGLLNYLTKERLELHKHLFSAERILKPFPEHSPIKTGIFVGQKIDFKNVPVYSVDARWEYEMRGKKFND